MSETQVHVDDLCRLCGRPKHEPNSGPEFIVCIGTDCPPDIGGLVRIAREEGRREILRRVQWRDVWDAEGMCVGCGVKDGHKMTCTWMVIEPCETEELAQNAGRLEILREIAALDPGSREGDMGNCNFCCGDLSNAQDDHAATCLWLRAKASVNA